MNKITLGKLFQLYYDTFKKFGIHLLDKTDEMLTYYVFEETDINIGFCSPQILKYLLNEGIIDESICEASSLFLIKFRELNDTALWNMEAVKTSPEWRAIMKQSDEIRVMIENRWTDEELHAIFEIKQPVDLNI